MLADGDFQFHIIFASQIWWERVCVCSQQSVAVVTAAAFAQRSFPLPHLHNRHTLTRYTFCGPFLLKHLPKQMDTDKWNCHVYLAGIGRWNKREPQATRYPKVYNVHIIQRWRWLVRLCMVAASAGDADNALTSNFVIFDYITFGELNIIIYCVRRIVDNGIRQWQRTNCYRVFLCLSFSLFILFRCLRKYEL